MRGTLHARRWNDARLRRLHASLAHRALLHVAEQNGDQLHDCWPEVLRCVSRFELLQQVSLVTHA